MVSHKRVFYQLSRNKFKLKLVGLSLKIRIVSGSHVVYAFSETLKQSVFVLKHVWVGMEEDTVRQCNGLRSVCLRIIIWDLRGAVGFSLSLDQSEKKGGFFLVWIQVLLFTIIKCSKNGKSNFHSSPKMTICFTIY